MKIWNIEDLQEWERNPTSITESADVDLQNELLKGQHTTFLVTETGLVLGGNHRLRRMRDLGYKTVKTIEFSVGLDTDKGYFVSLDQDPVKDPRTGEIIKYYKSPEDAMMDYSMSHNTGFVYYDPNEIANLVGNYPDIDFGSYRVDTFPIPPLQDLLDKYREDVIEDEAPPVSTDEPVSVKGEVYQLGQHRLMCGDATTEDVATLMAGQKADMTFTDPPYNVNYEGKTKDALTIQGDSADKDSFRQFLKASCEKIIENTKGAIYICMSSSELDALKPVFEEAGGHWQSFIIWVKNNFTLSRADYQHTYEPILYGWPKKGSKFFVDDRDLPNVWEELSKLKTAFDGEYTTIKFQGFEVKVKGKVEGEVRRKKQKIDIWRHDKPNASEDHPTMKPIALVVEALINSSKQEDIILDPFGGSGSTLIACQQRQRICYMMELDPKYVDVIRKRYAKFIGKETEWQEITPRV